MTDQQFFNSACRSDFYTFMQKGFTEIDSSQEFKGNWHLELICNKLEQCIRGDIRRLIINIPPRNLKSHCASICLPAYILGHDPNARVVCISYAQELANKLSRKTRKLMESNFYKGIFQTRLGDKNTENEFETTKNGFRYATSVGGSLTGDGGSYIIIDDPIKADDATSETKRGNVNEWYNSTVASRLNNKVDGVIILIMQRLHIDDLTGHLLKQDGWEVLSLPAVAEKDESFTLSDGRVVGRKAGDALNPKLEPLEILEKQKQIMSNYNFSAQYQQRPIPDKGNIINFDDFQLYDYYEIPQGAITLQSWDIALKDGQNNDYSVCITAKYCNSVLYIEEVTRYKLDMLNLVGEMYRLYSSANANHIIIEDSSIATHLLQYLNKEGVIHPILYRPQGNKITRANNASLHIKSGRVRLREGASWLADFKAEINVFPHGKHDDQVDALSQLIDEVTIMNSNSNLAAIADAIERYEQKQAPRELFLKQAMLQYRNKPPGWKPPF